MKDQIKKKSIVFIYFLFVAIVFFMIITHKNGNRDEHFIKQVSLPFRQNWYYEYDNGESGRMDLPGNLPKSDAKKVFLKHRLPNLTGSESLFFRVRHVYVKVYVGGELRVNTFPTVDSEKTLWKLVGIYYQEIPISEKDSGKEVVIESASTTTFYLQNPGTVYLGDRGSLFLTIVHTKWKTVLCCIFLTLLGILLLGLWMLETFVLHQSTREVLCLAFFCLAVSLWLFTESDFGQFFIKDTGKLTILAYEVLMLMPVPIALFFVYYSERELTKTASNVVAAVPLVVFLINNTLHSLHMVHLADTLIITQIMLALETVSIAVIQIAGLRYNYQKKEEYRANVWMIPLCGIAILVPMATIEVIKYAFFATKYPNDGILISIGVLFYMFALAFDTMVRMNMKAERFKQSAEVKTQFLANMSHEIRTPLNAILGFNEVILRTTSEKKVLEYSSNIHEAGESLKTIINSILDISKIESGKLVIYSTEYSTMEFFDHIISMFESLAHKKGLFFRSNIDENLPETLIGDETHIAQVLTNILSNAVKYTERGSITFTVQVLEHEEMSSQCTLYFSVKDTGIGIRQEDMKRLFEKFERLDEKRNYHTEGTGLGMSIVVQLLRAMDSEIEVDSVYGLGSNFHFVLKQQVMNPSKIGSFLDRRYDILRKEKMDAEFTAPDARILVVDDLQMNLDTAKVLLEQLKIQIDTAESGMEALEKMKRNHYDIVLMDHMMPDMDGIETTQRIRNLATKSNDHYYSKLPILALTANAVVGMRETFLQAGMQDFISKPIEIGTLYATIKRWLPEDKVILKDSKITMEESDMDDVQADVQTNAQSNSQTDEMAFTEDWITSEDVPDCIDVEIAKQYCMNYDLFIHNVKTYVSMCDTTCEKLWRYEKERDLENYTITVHGLKSSSKMIGAVEISEMAWQQEKECQAGNAKEVWNHTKEFTERYQKDVEDLQKFLSRKQKTSQEEGSMVLSLEDYDTFRNRVKEAALTYDFGGFLLLEEEFETIHVPEEKKQEFEEIKNMVVNADFGKLIEMFDKELG